MEQVVIQKKAENKFRIQNVKRQPNGKFRTYFTKKQVNSMMIGILYTVIVAGTAFILGMAYAVNREIISPIP